MFVDGTYIVKGVAGTLLWLMLDWHLSDGKSEKQAPIRLVRVGRGRVKLEAEGPLTLDATAGDYP